MNFDSLTTLTNVIPGQLLFWQSTSWLKAVSRGFCGSFCSQSSRWRSWASWWGRKVFRFLNILNILKIRLNNPVREDKTLFTCWEVYTAWLWRIFWIYPEYLIHLGFWISESGPINYLLRSVHSLTVNMFWISWIFEYFEYLNPVRLITCWEVCTALLWRIWCWLQCWGGAASSWPALETVTNPHFERVDMWNI